MDVYFRDKSVRVYKWQVGDSFIEVKYSPLIGHTYAVNSIDFSPFGTKLASASTDGTTIIWDVKVIVYEDFKILFLYIQYDKIELIKLL